MGSIFLVVAYRLCSYMLYWFLFMFMVFILLGFITYVFMSMFSSFALDRCS